MGLFGSIGHLFSGIGKALFGSGDHTEVMSPSQFIQPPSAQEIALLNLLFPQAQQMGQMANDVLNQEQGMLTGILPQLQNISQGNLPAPFKHAVNSIFSQQLGGILNNLAQRGVINSSVTQNAIRDAMTRASDLQVNYLPTALNLTTAPLNLLNTYRTDLLGFPANLYGSMMSARYRVPGQVIVHRGSPGLLGVFGSALGQGLGHFLGSSLF